MLRTDVKSPFLDGQLLIAAPGMTDPRFAEAVVLVCTHSDNGAMGVVVNRPANGVRFADIVEQLDVGKPDIVPDIPLRVGGPVERSRGFVLHSPDYDQPEATVKVTDWCSLTGHVEVLRALVDRTGPADALLALGYSNWASDQLEGELRDGSWLVLEADRELVFATPRTALWSICLDRIGVDPAMLHRVAGSA
ncbi:YqgE/AlgH family protein [Roseobacter sp. HKCCA0434]|uniref:YqgE/AlgH family protein n=1 Tax=Roseobacter sp. HKCCA0434 TaxID=3079297 RepID=UPI002905E4DE|nr:YqgE/AlgH family protein [Roseobacter sp. HKCCA0434]